MLVDTLSCPLTSTAGHGDRDPFDACAIAARGALKSCPTTHEPEG